MIDTPIFFFYIETMHNLLIFARFQSIFSMTVWNTTGTGTGTGSSRVDEFRKLVFYISSFHNL